MDTLRTSKNKLPLNEEGADRVFEGIKKPVEDLLAKLDNLYSPYWNARNEFMKSIISLASASIVLTVTFSGSFSAARGSAWKYLLFGSWILFLLSLVCALLSLWLSTQFKRIPSLFLSRQGKIRDIIAAINAEGPDPSDAIASMIATPYSRIVNADKWARRYVGGSLVTFILALFLLGLFGWKQFAV